MALPRYAAVWLFGLAAAVLTLLGEGGFNVAVLAVVPLVLLAPRLARSTASEKSAAPSSPDLSRSHLSRRNSLSTATSDARTRV